MANPVIRSIIRTTDFDDPPEDHRTLHRKHKHPLYYKGKKKKKTIKKTKTVKKPRIKRRGSYAGYNNLTDHPLPHVDHESDLMEHIGHEYKMMK